MKKILAIIMMVTLVGCGTTQVSMNYQRSAGRCAGDLTATVILELQHKKISPEQVLVAVESAKGYLNGDIDWSTITKAELILGIEDKIKVKSLKSLAYKLVNRVQDENIQNSKGVLIAVCDGLITGAKQFKLEDMKVVE